jgi:hypothetical protein
MALAAGMLIVLALIFGPSLWVKLVMKRYSSEKPEIPGTGGELAKHLIEQFSLKDLVTSLLCVGLMMSGRKKSSQTFFQRK